MNMTVHEDYLPEAWVSLCDDKIEGTSDKYTISSYGRVWNKLDKCFVSPVLSGIPQYNYVNIRVGVVRKLRRVHYLQAYSFFGAPPNDNGDVSNIRKQSCDHIDRNKYNNSLWNLRWLDRKGQIINRDNTVLCGGYPLTLKIEEDFMGSMDFTRGSFIKRTIRDNPCTYEEAKFLYLQWISLNKETVLKVKLKGVLCYVKYLCKVFQVPYKRATMYLANGYTPEDLFINFKVVEKDFSSSYEVNGMWYPNKTKLGIGEGINEDTLRARLYQGMSIDEALSYDYIDRYRKTVDNFFMTPPEHCSRLGVSLSKVETYMFKHNITLEEALEKAKTPQRVIKHMVTCDSEEWGVFNERVMRNKAWWEFFNLPPKVCNSKMCRGQSMVEVLDYKGIDTTGLTITPYTM